MRGTWRTERSSQGTVSQSFAGECGRRERQYRRKRDGTAGHKVPDHGVQQDKMQLLQPGFYKEETFSGQDHSSCVPGSMCITGQPGTSGICFCSVVCGDPHCCGSDFFDCYSRHCGDSRRYCDHRGWGLFDPEICCCRQPA